ncbi:MAG: hypothetical protein H7177_02140 [Rhizobacter sp.]|nr:hypothetical protein [Bacteriovorax sp.]
MKLKTILLSTMLITLASCATGGPKLGTGMGFGTHKPPLDNTLVINKRDGLFRIGSVKAENTAMDKVLNGNLMPCNSTTFSMPRSNTVGSFMREVFENEISTAKKYSVNGTSINVNVKSIVGDQSKLNSGSWKIIIDYTEDDKTMTVETTTTYESKASMFSGCTNTADVFEEALADNLVSYFKKNTK